MTLSSNMSAGVGTASLFCGLEGGFSIRLLEEELDKKHSFREIEKNRYLCRALRKRYGRK